MDAPDDDDLRLTELETLEAIYPEIRRSSSPGHPFTFDIELPVQPADPVTVKFPAAAGNAPAAPPGAGQQPLQNGQLEEDSLQMTHLPSLLLRVTLPDGYPTDVPPVVHLSTNPPWLPQETLSKLESDAPRLWEDMGRDMVAFSYIDHVHRAADDVFGAVNADGTLEVDAQHKLAILDHDIKAKKEAFNNGTYDCGICLDPKKGTKCHQMLDCSHVFCLQCLQDFYNNAITEGNLSTVRCLDPGCAKERKAGAAAAHSGDAKTARRPKIALNPNELLQIGLSEETVKRYVMLKYKTKLESDKNTVYCPRKWCGGAAKSNKHKKPSGLDLGEESGSESEQEEDKTEKEEGSANSDEDEKKPAKKKYNPNDLLAVCEDCGYAFCSRCYNSWHGVFYRCAPKSEKDKQRQLTKQEQATLDYLKQNTSPCPTCCSPAQKTHGCNHMICYRCDTHFCYLCSAWLDPSNPYRHYNVSPAGAYTPCYMRLWDDKEHGDQREDIAPGVAADVQDDEIPVLEYDNEQANLERRPAQRLDERGHPVAVDREAPLVLRLTDDRPNETQPPAQPADLQQQPAVNRGQNQPARGGPAARGGRARGRGARGRGGRAVAQAAGAIPRPRQQLDPNAGLNEAQEAWVRHFVQMALLDAEDEVEDDWGENEELFWIR